MNPLPDRNRHYPYFLTGLGLLFWTLYALGMIFPDIWWTTHWLAFIPSFWGYGLLIISGVLIGSGWIRPGGIQFPKSLQELSDDYGKWLAPGIAIGMGFLMYYFPIRHDYYGDAYKVLQYLNQQINQIPIGTNEAFFKFGLSPWDGHTTVLAIVTYLAYFAGITYGKAFLVLDAVCGACFVWLWLSFLHDYLDRFEWRLIMSLAGISAPFMLIYYGHIESYAPVFLCFLAWLVLSIRYTSTRKRIWLWSLVPLLILCIKLHPIAVLLIPALGLLFLQEFQVSFSAKVENWKGIGLWVLLPIFSAGAILYFGVFQDHVDTRSLNETAMEFDHLFLPLVSPAPPLDRYNLLSFNHLFDYACEMLLWSPVSLLLVLLVLIEFRREISWNSLVVRVTGLSLLLFVSLFFMINPLLSMQLDWDLMALPAPLLLVFSTVLIKYLEKKSFASRLLPISLALTILSIPAFTLHTQTDALSRRLENLGIRMYHTYYEWSAKVIQYSLNLPEYTSRQAYEDRKTQVLAKLQPHAIADADFEYARLLIDEGKYYLRVKKDYEKALTWLKQAEYYYPMEKNGLLYRMETHFLLGQYEPAFQYARKLIEIRYPSEKESIGIAIQCALEAEEYEEALSLSRFYVDKWDDAPSIREVKNRLEAKAEIETLKLLFAQPDS